MEKIERIYGLPTTGAKAFYLIDNFYTVGKPVICILNSDEIVENLEEDSKSVALYFGEKNIPTVFTYSSNINKRLLTLHYLENRRFDFLLTTNEILSRGTIPREKFLTIRFQVDKILSRENIFSAPPTL